MILFVVRRPRYTICSSITFIFAHNHFSPSFETSLFFFFHLFKVKKERPKRRKNNQTKWSASQSLREKCITMKKSTWVVSLFFLFQFKAFNQSISKIERAKKEKNIKTLIQFAIKKKKLSYIWSQFTYVILGNR